MHSWSAPAVPTLPVQGPPVALHDTSTGELTTLSPQGTARLYVCGITPYDATHLGHAATYLGFDLLNRAWRNAGHQVLYAQNITDVDDPLLERATKVGIEWTALAERETQLFREDMTALRVLPPDHYIGAVESIPLAVAMIEKLRAGGAIYEVETDLYFSVRSDPAFGRESGYDEATMLRLFAERGGDPDRAGKRDPLDCVVWRGERPGEPAWPSPFGPGRPGWHIECAAIAMTYLGETFEVQGGGSDLVFPHHEMCAGHAQVAAAGAPFAQLYSHAGMVGYDGAKMSKSRGNLVFVSALRHADIDPMAIRLALLRHHFRADWEWADAEVFTAVDDLARWRRAFSLGAGAPSGPVVDAVLGAMADDLDAPRACAAIDAWVAATLGTDGLAETSDRAAAQTVGAVVDAALGLAL